MIETKVLSEPKRKVLRILVLAQDDHGNGVFWSFRSEGGGGMNVGVQAIASRLITEPHVFASPSQMCENVGQWMLGMAEQERKFESQ